MPGSSEQPRHHVIAIDGPSGSGKSSVSKAAASTFGFRYLDTGAMYRAVALWMSEHGVDVNDLDDEEQPVKLRARGKTLTFARREGDALSVPAGPVQLVNRLSTS